MRNTTYNHHDEAATVNIRNKQDILMVVKGSSNVVSYDLCPMYCTRYKRIINKKKKRVSLMYVFVSNQEPFISRTVTSQGQEQYQGFLVDLLNEIAKKAGFTYKFKQAADRKYGSPMPGGWTGIIGDVVSGVSVFAVVNECFLLIGWRVPLLESVNIFCRA